MVKIACRFGRHFYLRKPLSISAERRVSQHYASTARVFAAFRSDAHCNPRPFSLQVKSSKCHGINHLTEKGPIRVGGDTLAKYYRTQGRRALLRVENRPNTHSTNAPRSTPDTSLAFTEIFDRKLHGYLSRESAFLDAEGVTGLRSEKFPAAMCRASYRGTGGFRGTKIGGPLPSEIRGGSIGLWNARNATRRMARWTAFAKSATRRCFSCARRARQHSATAVNAINAAWI